MYVCVCMCAGVVDWMDWSCRNRGRRGVEREGGASGKDYRCCARTMDPITSCRSHKAKMVGVGHFRGCGRKMQVAGCVSVCVCVCAHACVAVESVGNWCQTNNREGWRRALAGAERDLSSRPSGCVDGGSVCNCSAYGMYKSDYTDNVMRALRGRTSGRGDPVDVAFFVQLGTPGPPPPWHPGSKVGKSPRGTRPPVDKGPCHQRGQSGSISTSPGIRGGNTDLGLSIATPPGRRRESGCDFARATASIRRGSRTMQSFGCGRLDTCCTWRTMQTRTCRTCTCGVGVQRVQRVQTSPRTRASAHCLFPNPARCKEAPGRGHVRRLPKVPRFGGAGGCWGAGCFHSMVLEDHRAGRGAETRAAGRRRILGGGGTGGTWRRFRQVCLCEVVYVRARLCYRRICAGLNNQGRAPEPPTCSICSW